MRSSTLSSFLFFSTFWIIQKQFGRRNINNYQRSRLALELEGLFQKKAKANLSLVGGDRKSEEYKEKSPCQISDNPIIEIDTKKELARIAKVSHDNIATALKTIMGWSSIEIADIYVKSDERQALTMAKNIADKQ